MVVVFPNSNWIVVKIGHVRLKVCSKGKSVSCIIVEIAQR